jgi:hypothetical protein
MNEKMYKEFIRKNIVLSNLSWEDNVFIPNTKKSKNQKSK